MISASAEISNHFPLKCLQWFLLSILLGMAWGKACEVSIHHERRAVIYRLFSSTGRIVKTTP